MNHEHEPNPAAPNRCIDTMQALQPLRRRRVLTGITAMAAMAATARAFAAPSKTPPRVAPSVTSHFPFGAVNPVRPIPASKVTTHEGRATDLAALLVGQVTAVQLIFTGCSAICPIQGALFAQTQAELARRALPMRLMSISIDPMGDTPAALSKWLRQFSAGAGWIAVAPRVGDVDLITDLLTRGGEKVGQSADVHSGQVFIVNRRAELVYRTVNMPPPAQLTAALEQIARAT